MFACCTLIIPRSLHRLARSGIAVAGKRIAPLLFDITFLLIAMLLGVVPVMAAQLPAPAPDPGRWSQLADTVFQNFSLDNGLPHSIVTALAEDGDGFLWAGTQGGLARWDGYRFHNYLPHPGDPGALPDNYIEILYTDSRKRLWIGTSGGGLARYDRENDRFIHTSAGPGGLSHVAVRAISDDGEGGVWVGTDGGLDHLDPASGVVSHQSTDANDVGSLLPERVRALLLDHDGTLWVGTHRGLMSRVRGATHFSPVALPPEDGNADQKSRQAIGVVCLVQSADGRIWLGTDKHGVYALDPKTGTVRALRETGAGGSPLATEWVQTIMEGRPGEIWAGTFGQGIVAFDIQTMQTRRIRHDQTLPNSLGHNTVLAMVRDRAGLIWAGTQRGLSRHDPGQDGLLTLFGESGRVRGLSDADVWSVLPLADDRIWLGLGNNGVDILDPSGLRVGELRPDGTRPETALQKGRVFNMVAFGREIFLGTDRGLYRADSRGKAVRHFALSPRNAILPVRALMSDDTYLWIGGSMDGLWRFDLRGGPTAPAQRPPGADQLTDQRVTVITAGPTGSIWIGTRNGLNLYQPTTGIMERILTNPADPTALASGFIASLFTDRQGRLWVGTLGAGINVLEGRDAAGKPRFRHIGQAQGLPNANIDRFFQDKTGLIWASTDGGMVRIDPVSFAIEPLSGADGVALSGFWSDAGGQTAQGEMLFGGTGGLLVVRPQRFRVWDYRAPLMITDLLVGGRPVSASRFNGGAPRRASPAQKMLIINADANRLAVEFAALDYSAPERNRYAYRLEGYDQDWVDTDASRRLAAYANLPPGDYRLHLRGSNRNGVWSSPELVLPIRVLPAWYQTWWLRLIAGLAVVAAVAGLVQGRTKYLRQRQRELEDLVAKRTTQLKEKQGELLQQAKIASLGTLTAGVAHEINNPANFAHVGAFNLGNQLVEFQQYLLRLAGDDAPEDLVRSLQGKFDMLGASLAAIREGTTRIRDLVKDLRTFSRLDEADWKAVAIADSLRATINLVRTHYAGEVEIRCELTANPVLECWPAQLNQVFMNLIVNACQAISGRPAAVRAAHPGLLLIRSRIVDTWLVFEFEDNGGGIAQDVIERIFDPFFTTKTVGDGMGMGLSICVGIIEKHHGTITVTSVEGEGSCFTLKLPLPA
jgi:signal transduction histidine kinase/ligand-binding sensor domain-containing protein